MGDEILTPDQLREMVGRQIEANRSSKRESLSQAALDAAIDSCFREGEIELAAALMIAVASRVDGDMHGMLTIMLQRAVDRRRQFNLGVQSRDN